MCGTTVLEMFATLLESFLDIALNTFNNYDRLGFLIAFVLAVQRSFSKIFFKSDKSAGQSHQIGRFNCINRQPSVQPGKYVEQGNETEDPSKREFG